MAELFIEDADLVNLKGKVVIVTGGSSGIGLATVNLLLSHGASVVSADINSPPEQAATTSGGGAFLFVKTDVASWRDLCALFAAAQAQYSRIDGVFANAGIGPRANYLALETSDDDGELIEPSTQALDVMLRGVINTACLAAHYMKQQQPPAGSIVLMGSSTGLQPLRIPDYSTAKHGVLGFGRGFSRLMSVTGLPIRVNTLMPSWTATNLLPDISGIAPGVSNTGAVQDGPIVARAAAFLLVDEARQGDVVFVHRGKYTEIEKAVLAPAREAIQGGPAELSDDEVVERILARNASVEG
ncbi:uncharacterized protein L3040_000530 [Drepanopeziza brunnea f. sp. 'multigermtubi']|uniref:uncharacterized protein n=1 Tax=Drepanopeziza brunnea f. sp. 'multigermtubi' TaxID=698441 RepID=UPI0023A58B58|nr:hypothetical protein L3040_000530 [Drepanopeziza brunnea f. sp. 'multigermtubi']